jgi:hypothetical protein
MVLGQQMVQWLYDVIVTGFVLISISTSVLELLKVWIKHNSENLDRYKKAGLD